MSNLKMSFGVVGLLAIALSAACAQDDSTQPASANGNQQEPVPAYGQENPTPMVTENPPISGIDQPGLEPHAAPLSYLQPGVTVSESADSNVANTLGGNSFNSVSRALGSIDLRRLWSNYDLALGYIGGVGYYANTGGGLKSLQGMDVQQKVEWKRGQFALRDSFSYLPEGVFGGAYGALGSIGISSLGTGAGLPATLNGGSLGALGQTPRVANVSLADVSEYLSPKSAVTAIGSYAFTHFYGNDAVTGGSFINSSEISGLAGYDRILTPHTQIAAVYGYQQFDFSAVGTQIHAQIVQGMYSHRISGRMDFLVSAGPQFIRISIPCTLLDVLEGNSHCTLQGLVPVGSVSHSRIGVAGRVQLRYRFTKTSLIASYDRVLTTGSGFFAGAESDIARLSVSRPLSRVWTGFADMGFSRNSREGELTPAELNSCLPTSSCPGVVANIFYSGFAGAGVRRSFGRNFHMYTTYQFNQLWFDTSYCVAGTPCNRIGTRHVITAGLDWTPRPIRID